MILEFRTRRNANGNCKYVAIDTGTECYSTSSRSFIAKDIPELSAAGYKEIIRKCEAYEYQKVHFVL